LALAPDCGHNIYKSPTGLPMNLGCNNLDPAVKVRRAEEVRRK